MIRINLIPPEYIANINRRAVIAKAVLGGVLMLAAVVMLSLWQITRAESLKTTMAQREKQLSLLQGDVEKVNAIAAEIAEVQRYLDAITRIAKGRFIYTKFLQDTARNLPATIWFTSINTSLSGDVMMVSFAVSSRSSYDLAYWLNALETNSDYSNVTLGSISISEGESGKVLTTQLSLRYVYK
jgi:Tfp pilus assembly protein PilN